MARLVVHPCRTGNPGVVLHACTSTVTLCGEPVDLESIGQPWGFRAVCTLCYPLKDPEDAQFPAPRWETFIQGRETWPASSDEVLRLDRDEEEDAWKRSAPSQDLGVSQTTDTGESPDETPPDGS